MCTHTGCSQLRLVPFHFHLPPKPVARFHRFLFFPPPEKKTSELHLSLQPLCSCPFLLIACLDVLARSEILSLFPTVTSTVPAQFVISGRRKKINRSKRVAPFPSPLHLPKDKASPRRLLLTLGVSAGSSIDSAATFSGQGVGKRLSRF